MEKGSHWSCSSGTGAQLTGTTASFPTCGTKSSPNVTGVSIHLVTQLFLMILPGASDGKALPNSKRVTEQRDEATG